MLLDDVIDSCAEPLSDVSLFPTMLVSRMAAKRVKVVLSGDGGDELFWGYAGRFSSVMNKTSDFRQPYWLRSTRWGAKKVFNVGRGYMNLRFRTIGDWYRARHTKIQETLDSILFPEIPQWPADFTLFDYKGYKAVETAQWLRWNEFMGHLTMVLLKVDRASMYHSLEVRVPFLDREVVQAAARIDWESCLDTESEKGKLLLRKILLRRVNHHTHDKKGFDVPMSSWLRGPLRKVFEDALFDRTDVLGFPINPAGVKELFVEHLSGNYNHEAALWNLLNLALWEESHLRASRLV
jgi:asparagine synthase (glutamine-hydrolysing)